MFRARFDCQNNCESAYPGLNPLYLRELLNSFVSAIAVSQFRILGLMTNCWLDWHRVILPIRRFIFHLMYFGYQNDSSSFHNEECAKLAWSQCRRQKISANLFSVILNQWYMSMKEKSMKIESMEKSFDFESSSAFCSFNSDLSSTYSII